MKPRAFTLVELLVVVLILAILMAIALPLYLSAVANATRRTCRSNLQTIANAVQAARVKARALNYGTWASAAGTDPSGSLPDLQYIPLCPEGGSYTVRFGSTGDAQTYSVHCSFAGHGDYEPGVSNE